MRNIQIIILAYLCMAFASCAREGSPHEQGQLLTAVQIKSLDNDQFMNGKLVTIEGFAGFCSRSSFFTLGKLHSISIYSEGYCEGEHLIDAKIMIDSGSIPLSGEKNRNYVHLPKSEKLSNEELTFMTDDYQEITNRRMKFSGKIIYDDNQYYLTNLSIHQ